MGPCTSLARMSDSELHYELTRAHLDNGLEIVVAPDFAAPGVAVNLWVEVGSADEQIDKSGFAHLFEHLMFQGSANVASGEHMATIEALGGSVNATTSSDRTNYFETVPGGALDLALWLEADRFASLAITPENFEAQREVVKEEKRQRYDNQPYGDLLELLIAQHFSPEHPYGHLTIGSMEDLDAASLDDVASFFHTWYRPSNTRLVVCGPVGADEALTLVEKHFGSLSAAPRPAERNFSSAKPLEPQRTLVTRPVPHSLSYLSWDAPPAADHDFVALDLTLGILTDGTASRLHRALVKDRPLAHEVHASALPHRSSTSIVTILGRPAEGVSLEALDDAILSAIATLAEHGPTPDELQRAVAQFEREYLWALATTSGRADAINDLWLTHGDPAYVNRHLSDVFAVTAEEIQASAARWLTAAGAHHLHYRAEGDAS